MTATQPTTPVQTAGAGVMDASYARDRLNRPHLVFRYKSRALIAYRLYRKFSRFAHAPRILDMGAAEGRTMAELHRLLGAEESIGIEYAPDLIAAAGDLPDHCRLLRGDVTKPIDELKPGSFELITALAVLEHLDNPAEMAVRVREYLKPGGIFIATCPSPFWDKVSGAVGLHKDEHHTMEFNKQAFTKLALKAGLEPLEYRPFMFAPVGFLPYLKISVPPRLAMRIDALIAPIPILNLMMVNQVFAARRPPEDSGTNTR